MRHLILAFVLPALFALAACADMNPVATAQTPEQKAFAAYGTFVVLKEEAADIAVAPGTPRAVVQAIATGNRVVTPLARTMVVAAREYVAAKAEIDALKKSGVPPPAEMVGQVGILLNRLLAAYAAAEPEIARFAATVKSVKGG